MQVIDEGDLNRNNTMYREIISINQRACMCVLVCAYNKAKQESCERVSRTVPVHVNRAVAEHLLARREEETKNKKKRQMIFERIAILSLDGRC